MLALENPAGRLVTLRIVYPVVAEELPPFGAKLKEILLSQPGRFLTAVDLREADVFARPVQEFFLGVMKGDNPKMERSGFLIGDTAILGLQVERLVREAGSQVRQTFREPEKMLAWLSEISNPVERAALSQFIAAGSRVEAP